MCTSQQDLLSLLSTDDSLMMGDGVLDGNFYSPSTPSSYLYLNTMGGVPTPPHSGQKQTAMTGTPPWQNVSSAETVSTGPTSSLSMATEIVPISADISSLNLQGFNFVGQQDDDFLSGLMDPDWTPVVPATLDDSNMSCHPLAAPLDDNSAFVTRRHSVSVPQYYQMQQDQAAMLREPAVSPSAVPVPAFVQWYDSSMPMAPPPPSSIYHRASLPNLVGYTMISGESIFPSSMPPPQPSSPSKSTWEPEVKQAPVATKTSPVVSTSTSAPATRSLKRRHESEDDDEMDSKHQETGMPSPPPTSDKSDPSAAPRRQKVRYDGDCYTPRWVRYTGQMKEGYCDTCQPGKWLQLKNSAYWYHKQFYHGISSVSGKRFMAPIKQRAGENDVVEGLCHQCGQYVPICNTKRKNHVLWYRHAHKCHIYDKPKGVKAVKRSASITDIGR